MSDSEATPPPPTPSTPVSNPFEGLDVEKIKSAGLPTKLMLGGSVGFFIFAFFEWWSGDVSIKSPLIGVRSASESGNAFHIWQGTLAWLLMIAVAVLAIVMLLKGAEKNLVTAALACSGLGTLLTLWYWLRIPSEDDLVGESGGGVLADSIGMTIDVGASIGLFLGLIAAIVATVGAVMTFQASQQSN